MQASEQQEMIAAAGLLLVLIAFRKLAKALFHQHSVALLSFFDLTTSVILKQICI